MTDERPTLTIAVACPTCGGCKRVRYWNDEVRPAQQHSLVMRDTHPCPKCTDGTIRQAVSCAGCKHYSSMLDYPGGPNDYGRCFFVTAGDERLDVLPDWGCLSWEAKA